MLKLRPHVLHIHASRFHSIPARILGIKTIERKNLTRETFHNTPSRNPLFDRIGNSFIQMTITPSEYLRNYYIERGLAKPGRIAVVYNGIEAGNCYEQCDCDAALGELGLGAGAAAICAVGRLVPLKGFNDLIAAMPLIAVKHPAARLLLIGDGPEAGALKEQASRLGAGGGVVFAGHRRDVPRLLRAGRVFVHPSHTEALSNAVLEAMAARCPAAVSDIPGNREIVSHEKTGLLFPPGDVEAIAAAVCRILDDDALAGSLSASARSLIETKFKKETMAQETEKLYSKLLGQ
jgi:glycosyltransferase involved in cell wall biosynthesis